MNEQDKEELKEKNVNNWKKRLFTFGKPATVSKEKPDEKESQEINSKEKPDEKESQEINSKEIFNVTEETLQKSYMRADCCHPIPGDDILGYLEQGHKMILHKRQCA
ncbi:GTP pyrophosphokinase, partial [termite gut metagenome]